MKKLLSIILAVVIITAVIPMNAFAASYSTISFKGVNLYDHSLTTLFTGTVSVNM